MPTPFESAQLILKLYEMRRETVLREARSWFLRDFNPDSIDEIRSVLAGAQSGKYRMVLGYWDMAASLVSHGAIDRAMFLDANGEIFGTFAKIHPLLAQIRELAQTPTVAKHMEAVVMSVPDIEPRLEMLRKRFRPVAK
ncbi:MAG: hypothetical protein ABI639_09630 [Thermoanaerobaculia bacterium]